MCGSLRCVGEDASRLNNDVYAHRSPRKLGGIFCGEDFDALSINDELVTLGNNRAGKGAVGGVMLKEERIHLRINKIVDRHHLNFRGAF